MDTNSQKLQEKISRPPKRSPRIDHSSVGTKDKMKGSGTSRHHIQKIVKTFKKRNTFNSAQKFVGENKTSFKIEKKLSPEFLLNSKKLSFFTQPVHVNDNSTNQRITFIYTEQTDRLFCFLLTLSFALTVVCVIFAIIFYVLRPNDGSSDDEDEHDEYSGVEDPHDIEQDNSISLKIPMGTDANHEISLPSVESQVELDNLTKIEDSRIPSPNSEGVMDLLCSSLKNIFLMFLLFVQQGRRNRAVTDIAFVDDFSDTGNKYVPGF